MAWFRRSVHPEEDLSAYVDGELGERARRAVEEHLATCEACSTLLSELQSTKSLLSELPRVEPRRSFTLGQEYAVQRREAPAPKRSAFTFAPAAALSVLVALLFVDALDTTGGSSNDSGAFSTGSTASKAAEQPEAGAGLALESANADDAQGEAAGGAAASEPQDGDKGATPEAALAPPAADSQAAPDSAPAAAGAAPEATSAQEDAPLAAPAQDETSQPEEAPQPQARESFDDDAADSAAGGPEDTSELTGTDGSSGGLSTLRILEIVAAAAFVGSLGIVFLPRFVGRSER